MIPLFLECKKDETVVVTGKVSEGYQNTGIANVAISLDFNEISNGSFSAGFKRLDETTSDANGNFTLEFDRVQAVSYRITGEADGFETVVSTVNGDLWGVGDDNSAQLSIFQTAELEITLRNDFPKLDTDQILFKLLSHSDGCTSCCSETILAHSGRDTSIVCKVYANQEIGYEYTLISSGSADKKTGRINIVAGSGNKIDLAY